MTGYKISTANDNASFAGRNPKAWTLYGSVADSNPGKEDASWEVIAAVTNDTKLKDVNYTTYTYTLPTETAKAYQSFKWVITERKGGGNNVIQVSEFCPTYTDALVGVPFPDDDTGIGLMFDERCTMSDGQWIMSNAQCYNLAGQRLSRPTKGVNIIQGKKVIKTS